MRVAKITYPDLNNGLGCRITIWLSGCDIRCAGCHNKELWERENSTNYTVKTLFEKIEPYLKKPYIKGITISGGEPFYKEDGRYINTGELESLCASIKAKYPQKDIWLYTGRSFCDIKDNSVIKYLDFIVTEPFKLEEKDVTLAFRGSKNQQIINLNESKNSNQSIDR